LKSEAKLVAILFLDSSALVKRYVPEAGSAWVRAMTASENKNRLYVARITGAEVVAAITRRQRRGDITPDDAGLVLTAFRHDFPAAFEVIEITSAIIGQAMNLAERHGLRGYDAVQLAAALTLHEQRLALGLPTPLILTADKELNAAAFAVGLTADDPNDHLEIKQQDSPILA